MAVKVKPVRLTGVIVDLRGTTLASAPVSARKRGPDIQSLICNRGLWKTSATVITDIYRDLISLLVLGACRSALAGLTTGMKNFGLMIMYVGTVSDPVVGVSRYFVTVCPRHFL